MDRYEHCMVEFYWAAPIGANPSGFKPGFILFTPGGGRDFQEGGNEAITALFNKLGNEGWRVTTSSTASNWLLWTLERKKP
jgi:hypothetical protein